MTPGSVLVEGPSSLPSPTWGLILLKFSLPPSPLPFSFIPAQKIPQDDTFTRLFTSIFNFSLTSILRQKKRPTSPLSTTLPDLFTTPYSIYDSLRQVISRFPSLFSMFTFAPIYTRPSNTYKGTLPLSKEPLPPSTQKSILTPTPLLRPPNSSLLSLSLFQLLNEYKDKDQDVSPKIFSEKSRLCEYLIPVTFLWFGSAHTCDDRYESINTNHTNLSTKFSSPVTCQSMWLTWSDGPELGQ